MEVVVSANSSKLGYLHLTNPAWGTMPKPRWQFLSDTLGLEEARRGVWSLIPQISATPVLCEKIPEESLFARRMLENQAIVTAFMGNRHAIKLLQVFQPIMEFNFHSIATERMMGMLEHCVTLMLGRGQTTEMVKMTGWNLLEEAKLLPLFDECSTPNHCLVMNIIAWNCRKALKPLFQNLVRELVHNHDLAIMIVMETRIGGDRARDITDRLPFDGAIHTDTIGFAGDLWLLWNSDKVQITQLAMSE